ncbi:MAG: SUMF1/EgtB/PvdO family nonheme iron enzyme [Candidatus Competibacteraceae bacterium]
MADTVRVFVSYSHTDDRYLGKNSLLGYLRGLEKDNVEFWTDREIKTGELWDDVIKAKIQEADIALVLVSQAFLDSDYCQNVEIQSFLAHKKHLFPIILSPCEWKRHDWLSSRQFLPGGDKTIERHYTTSGLRKELFLTIREQLRQRVESIRQRETSLPPAQQALLDIVRAEEPPTDLNLLPDTLAEILRQAPRNLTEYRLGRIADWSQPRYALDKRFIQLTLLLDKGENAQGPRWESSRQFQDLRDVLQETLDTPALVLLGPPGSGKSTLLRRLEWDLAVDALRDRDKVAAASRRCNQARLSFFVPLNQYQPARSGGPLPEPRQWLAEHWTRRFPGLPSLDDWLRAGKGVLLLDALNEMPSAGRDAIGLWKEFLLEMAQTCPGSRFIFSCRSLDYSSSLSSNDLPVPHVRIESLSDAQVEQFLQVYSPHGATLWRHLKGTPQLDLYRTPIYLKMLVNQADAEGHIPEGRAALFTGFVRQALQRERRADNPRFQPDDLLTEWDCDQLTQHQWKDACDLPSEGILIPKLSSLAYHMQEQRIISEASQVRIDRKRALTLLEHARSKDILKAGVDLRVVDIDVSDVLFIHQLMQEYFAARYLANAPDAERVRTDWRADRINPSLEQVLAKLVDADPLPPAPQTGWEETTVLAVAMSANPEAFVTALMETNLPLAGRCAAQPDVRISEALKTCLRWALVERTQDSNADLRARIAAGLSLGPLGDPRFERRKGPYGDYLLPPLVAIPGGTYILGSEEGEAIYINDKERECPIHQVQLAPFQIGKFPVTNAEWKLFMDAGGYENERWWDTEAAKAWWRGEGTVEGPKQQARENRQWFRDHLDSLHEYKELTSEIIKEWKRYAQMSDEEFEASLNESFPSGRQTQPYYWNDDAFNNPAQPVVGICWYEAHAYCAWLSAQTGQSFRLPTEAEWEAAARGSKGRRYAYGDDFDATHCNTFETRIRRTTPVGVFPGGETPEGLVDMTGNTWDWTSSLYRSYPYEAINGREEPTVEDRRVVRGGAWSGSALRARAAYRLRFHPGHRDDYLGVRVLVGPPPL